MSADPVPSKIPSFVLPGLLVFLSILIYLPALTVEFGFHNDYSMLLADRNNWLGFFESKHILMVGRAVGAVLATLQCWTMNRIADFTFWRLLSLGCVLLFVILLARFLKKRCSLEGPWAWLAGFLVMLLPVTQMSVLWVAHFMPGSFNILLATGSYLLFEKARGDGRLIGAAVPPVRSIPLLALAFVLFVAALFTYPPTALTVFIFTFAVVLFSPSARWPQARRTFIGDAVFWGLGMLAYRIIDRMIVYPWGVLDAKFHIPTQVEYNMRLTSHWAAKFQLLLNSLLDAAAGTWHLLLGEVGAGILLFIVSWGLFECFSRKQSACGSADLRIFWEKAGMLAALLFLANLPSFLAEGCFKVLGYRVLWPASVMLVLVLGASLRYLNRLEEENPPPEGPPGGRTVPYAILALVVIFALLAARNIGDSTRNAQLELRFVRAQLNALNISRVTQVIVIPLPKGATLIGRNLPYEFGYMITEFQHVAPIILQHLKARIAGEKQLSLSMIDPDTRLAIKIQPTDFVINLNQMREDVVLANPKPAAPAQP